MFKSKEPRIRRQGLFLTTSTFPTLKVFLNLPKILRTTNLDSNNTSLHYIPQYISPDNAATNQLSSFLTELRQLINPLFQLFTNIINK